MSYHISGKKLVKNKNGWSGRRIDPSMYVRPIIRNMLCQSYQDRLATNRPLGKCWQPTIYQRRRWISCLMCKIRYSDHLVINGQINRTHKKRIRINGHLIVYVFLGIPHLTHKYYKTITKLLKDDF